MIVAATLLYNNIIGVKDGEGGSWDRTRFRFEEVNFSGRESHRGLISDARLYYDCVAN